MKFGPHIQVFHAFACILDFFISAPDTRILCMHGVACFDTEKNCFNRLIGVIDAAAWCKEIIPDPGAIMERQGKTGRTTQMDP